RRGYVAKRLHESQPVGYHLTAEGRELIRDLLPPVFVLPAAGPPVELAFDPAELLRMLNDLAREYADAARRLRENRERRAQLQAELDQLDAEARDLNRKVHNVEVQSLMRRLARLTRQTS